VGVSVSVGVSWVTAVVLDVGASFWGSVTGSTLSPARGVAGDGVVTLVPEDGDPYLRVPVRGRSDGPSDVHLALHVDDLEGAVALAQHLGASVTEARAEDAVLTSPGGRTLGLVRQGGEQRRPPPHASGAGAGRSRSLVDQVCLDIQPASYDDETAFWTGLTGWERRAGSRPEFEYLVRPPEIPLRLLLQRVGDAPADRHTAHLDLACDDVGLEQRRHEELGATTVTVMPNWTTMRDPAGMAYCLTRRNPDTGML
jgi:Glyoxalase-like domain